jgi:pyruvate,orthophosphate dikinase
MAWVDQHRRLRVLANADTPEDAAAARAAGAEGIGLVRCCASGLASIKLVQPMPATLSTALFAARSKIDAGP